MTNISKMLAGMNTIKSTGWRFKYAISEGERGLTSRQKPQRIQPQDSHEPALSDNYWKKPSSLLGGIWTSLMPLFSTFIFSTLFEAPKDYCFQFWVYFKDDMADHEVSREM